MDVFIWVIPVYWGLHIHNSSFFYIYSTFGMQKEMREKINGSAV